MFGVCHQPSPVNSYLSVYAMGELLGVIKTGATRHECVLVHARSRMGIGACMRVSIVFTLQYRVACVCMYVYMYVNTAGQLQLCKAVILLLIMKNFVLKSLVFPHNYTM